MFVGGRFDVLDWSTACMLTEWMHAVYIDLIIHMFTKASFNPVGIL